MGAVFYPPLANTLVFILMAIVLLARPAGLFGTAESA
jgi:branched-chain amino acid transport system permease protein